MQRGHVQCKRLLLLTLLLKCPWASSLSALCSLSQSRWELKILQESKWKYKRVPLLAYFSFSFPALPFYMISLSSCWQLWTLTTPRTDELWASAFTRRPTERDNGGKKISIHWFWPVKKNFQVILKGGFTQVTKHVFSFNFRLLWETDTCSKLVPVCISTDF